MPLITSYSLNSMWSVSIVSERFINLGEREARTPFLAGRDISGSGSADEARVPRGIEWDRWTSRKGGPILTDSKLGVTDLLVVNGGVNELGVSDLLAAIDGVNICCWTISAVASPVLEERSRVWMFIRCLLMGAGPRCGVGFKLIIVDSCTEITGPSEVIVQ